MFFKEAIRAALTYMVGIAIALSGLALLIMVLLKALYASDTPFSRMVAVLYQSVPPFQWVWPWLPDFRAGNGIGSVIFTGPFLLGAILELIGIAVMRNAQSGFSIIKEATRQTRIAGLRGDNPRYRQSIGDISAGRDVHVQQIAEARLRVGDWENNFWRGPLGGLLMSVGATIVAAVITYLTGLTH